jgi:arylformamidase
MYLDLSITLYDNMPVYPGDPDVRVQVAAIFEKEGCLGHEIHLGNHAGTHIDAAAHMIEGGKTIDQYPLEQFFARCSYVPYDQTLEPAGFSVLDIRAGDIVVVDTGMWRRFEDPEYFTDYPAISTEFAEFLVDKRVRMVGVDTCSVDNIDSFPVHKILLGRDILVAENLTNVTELSSGDFEIIALPISSALDASPARIIAKAINE